MSDRVTQTLTNLTFEVSAIAVDQLALYRRLNELNPNLVSDSDVQVVAKRLKRLQEMYRVLQQQKDD